MAEGSQEGFREALVVERGAGLKGEQDPQDTEEGEGGESGGRFWVEGAK